jgi:hypothetical protein
MKKRGGSHDIKMAQLTNTKPTSPLANAQGQIPIWDLGGQNKSRKSTRRPQHLNLGEVPLPCRPWYVANPKDHYPETHQKINTERGEIPENICSINFKGLQCRHCGWTGPTQRRKQHVYTHLGYKPYHCRQWCVNFSLRIPKLISDVAMPAIPAPKTINDI